MQTPAPSSTIPWSWPERTALAASADEQPRGDQYLPRSIDIPVLQVNFPQFLPAAQWPKPLPGYLTLGILIPPPHHAHHRLAAYNLNNHGL